jgi:hypothetical protein
LISLTNANPDFYRAKITETSPDSTYGERTVIYSTLEDLTIGQIPGANQQIEQIPGNRNLTVYALNLTLIGEIVIPSGDIKIYCKTLQVPSGAAADTPAACLKVSAAPVDTLYGQPFQPKPVTDASDPPIAGRSGVDIAAALAVRKGADYGGDPKINYKYGNKGDPAGSVTIFCDQIKIDGPLALQAVGGNGYAGCNGQQGGPCKNSRNKSGRGGDAQPGGNGGDGGQITVRYRTINDSSLINTDVAGGSSGVDGQPGKGGPPNGPEGNGAEPSISGEEGSSDISPYTSASDFGKECDEVFLLKVLQKAKMLYLNNQPTSYVEGRTTFPPEWEDLGKLLTWLRHALASYAITNDGAPLMDLRKRNLYQITAKLVTQYKQNYSYFGWESNWAPNLPIDEMFNAYKDSAATREKLEKAFLQMSKEFEKKEEAQKALDEQRAQLAASRDAYQMAYQEAMDELLAPDKLLKTLNLALARFTTAAAALQEAMSDTLKKGIENHFDFNIENIFKGLESLAFTGGEGPAAAAMGAVQVGEFVYNGLTKVTDNQGRAIDKNTLYQEIVTVSGPLMDAVKGEIFEKDPNGDWRPTSEKKALLATLNDFDKEIQSLSNSLGQNLIKPVSDAIGEYKSAIFEKGRAQILYNTYAAMAAENYEKHEEAQRRFNDAQDQPDPLSPYWISLVSHYAMLYQDQLDETAEAVSLLQRKVAYVTLDTQEKISVAKLLGALWTDGAPPAKEDMDSLDTKVDNLRKILDDYGSAKVSPSTPYPSDSSKRGNLTVHIIDPEIIKYFKEHKSIAIRTVPESKSGQKAPFRDELGAAVCEVSDSNDHYDIRVTTVRPRIIGVKTKSGSVIVNVRMSVQNGITGNDGTMYNFSHHYPRFTKFVHKINTRIDGETNDDMGQGDAGELTDRYLDAVGIYGQWIINLSEGGGDDTNEGLDLSQVTDIKVYFSGFARKSSWAEP